MRNSQDKQEKTKQKNEEIAAKPRYTQSIRDTDNPYANKDNQSRSSRNMSIATNQKNTEAKEDYQFRRASVQAPSDRNAKNIAAREDDQFRRASGQSFSVKKPQTNTRESYLYGGTKKSLQKSVKRHKMGSMRHLIGGYDASRGKSLTKRATPANSTNTLKNKYGC